MASTFYLEILASDHKFYAGESEELVFPAIDGLYGVLPGHEATVTAVESGELKFRVDGTWRYVAISDGFIQILPNKVVLLVDTAELPEEIDIKRAEEAKLRAEEKLRQKQSLLEYYQTQASLNRAMNRLKITSKRLH